MKGKSFKNIEKETRRLLRLKELFESLKVSYMILKKALQNSGG
jgi:hypothetical protein